MKLFIDTANVDEIREINELGIICGVTTNPTLIARAGKDFKEVIGEISEILDGPISAEVISTNREGMIEEAVDLSKIHSNIVIKIPMTKEGLAAVKELSKRGIKTNVTLIFSAQQAILAARAGATYVSPFIGRLEDIGGEGIGLLEDIGDIYETHGIDTEIIAASIRSPKQVLDAAKVGSDIATVPYKVLLSMMEHPLTDKGLDDFLRDWNEFNQDGKCN